MKTHRVRKLILLSFVAVLGSACHPSSDGDMAAEQAEKQAKLEPRAVRLVTPEVREQQPSIDLVGEVRAFDRVTVASQVAGTVEATLVEVGDRVEAGDPLVQIDREAFRLQRDQAAAQLAAARAEAELAERELVRKKDLVSDKTIPQATYDQAEASFELATARVARSEEHTF